MLQHIGLFPTKLVKNQLRYLYWCCSWEDQKWTSTKSKKLSLVLEDTRFTRAKEKTEAQRISDINTTQAKHPREDCSKSFRDSVTSKELKPSKQQWLHNVTNHKNTYMSTFFVKQHDRSVQKWQIKNFVFKTATITCRKSELSQITRFCLS